MSKTRAQVEELLSGAPRRDLQYRGHGYATDATGKLFEVKSAAQAEARRIWSAQQGQGRGHTFFFNGMDRLPYVSNALTLAQSGYLLILASYLSFDGVIVRSENDPEPMSTADMRAVLRLTGTKESTFYDFLDACMNYGIITKTDGGYAITRQFHFKGKASNDRVVRTFISRLRAMYSDVSAHDIGILYRLIPHIHKESNILCANPEEPVPSNVRKFNRKQLAEAVGVEPDIVTRAVKRMIFDGHSVFAKVTTATDGTFYMLNPNVFRRKDTEFDPAVRGIFGLDE